MVADARVAALLVELASPRQAEQQGALAELRDRLLVLGEVQPDASEVAPALQDLVLSGGARDRVPVTQLLADLAQGAGAPWLETRLGDWLSLLAADDDALRAVTAVLVGHSQEHAERAAGALRERLALEPTVAGRASMLVALGHADARQGCRADEQLFEAALGHESRLVKLAGACGLALTTEAPHAGATSLLASVADKPVQAAGFSWRGGDTVALAIDSLVDACLRHGDVQPLRAILERTKSPPLAARMVRRAFPERRSTPVLPSELGDQQRALLQAVAWCNTVMDELFTALNARGFTTHRVSLERFSGGAAPGPLDRVLAGVPLWKHMRDVMSGATTLGDLLASWSALTPEDTLAACEDALSYYMSLQLPFPAPFHPDALRAAAGFGRLTKLCADILGARVEKALLEERLRTLSAEPKQANPRLCAALLAAYLARGATADELGRFEPLIHRAITSGTDPVLREVIAHLDAPQRADIVLAHNPAAVFAGSGHVYHGCLPYLDLIPTARAAEVALGALSTLRNPPVDRIVEILVALGAPAVEAIEAALELDPPHPFREALARARDGIRARTGGG